MDACDKCRTVHLQTVWWPQLADSLPWLSCSQLEFLDTHPLDITAIRNLQM